MDIKKAIKKVTSTEYATFQEMKLVPELEVVLTNLMIGLGKKQSLKRTLQQNLSMKILLQWLLK